MASDPHEPLPPADPVGELAARLDLVGAAVVELEKTLADLRARVESPLPDHAGQGHKPIPAPRWHDLEGQERADAIERLGDWVRKVYLPVYGHLAAGLGACWPQHPLALVVLDHMSETWAVLYAQPTRSQRILSAQLEFQLRYVPAAAEMLKTETRGCGHTRPRTAL